MRSAEAHIATLQKRLEHLRQRTENNPQLTYDLAEAGSLEWAILNLQPIAEREKSCR